MALKPILIFVIITACLYTCKPDSNSENEKKLGDIYPTISYLKIKLDASGHLPSNPYIKTYKAGKKEIVFCGTNHLEDNSDTGNVLFKFIEQACFAFKPNVIINEGGDVSKKQYKSRNEAISMDGEIGLCKILSDRLKIPIVNGDMNDSLEFKALLKIYSKGDFMAYIGTERCMWGLKGEGINDSLDIEKRYSAFVSNYIEKSGRVKLLDSERGIRFYKSNYETLLKRPFDLETLAPTNPFDSISAFQKIGRSSKEIRDQNLLRIIDMQLKLHDKVFVVFGGWHLLTCEPGLEYIINQYK